VLIDEAIARWLRNKPTDGVEIAVLTPGRYRYARGYSADGAPTKNADQIPIHSITKTFTAALILRAVEDGRIRLEDRLGTLTVAPWFTVAEQVTVGQLLSHKSGIVTYTDTKTFKDDWQKIDGWEPALRGAQDAGLAFTPGSKQIYSSTNFIVLGLLAAQIYGLEIEKLIERDLLGPLNLDRTSIARPYPGSPGTGTGNMSAHITDLTRWANAMWREKTVLGAAGNQLTTYVDPVNMLGYGNFAYCPCTKQNGKTIPAAIGGNGAEATMRYYPGIDTIIVLRTPVNGPTKGVEELVTEILRITNS
jgi:CubicO group peptidase (beta-lactamase class C family)